MTLVTHESVHACSTQWYGAWTPPAVGTLAEGTAHGHARKRTGRVTRFSSPPDVTRSATIDARRRAPATLWP